MDRFEQKRRQLGLLSLAGGITNRDGSQDIRGLSDVFSAQPWLEAEGASMA